MLTRRAFSQLTALSIAAIPVRELAARSTPAPPVRTSVMLWTLAKLGSFEQRVNIVAEAGYRNVEFVDEFSGWSEAEWTRNLASLRTLGLSVDAMAGMKAGFADPRGADMFLAELQKLIPLAHRLACPQIILLSGPLLPGLAEGRQHQASVDTLRRAADLLAREHLTGVIEPIDRLEQPQIYLDGVTEAFTLTRTIANPNLKVLYDLYHEQRTHGNLLEKLQQNIDQVGLVHIADVPGRHEPGTGEIDYLNIYRALGQFNYKGVVAMEFYPSGTAVETLRHARLEAEEAFASAQAC